MSSFAVVRRPLLNSLAWVCYAGASEAAYCLSASRHLFARSIRRTFAGYVEGYFASHSCARTVRYSSKAGVTVWTALSWR
jgi:hypothetical protein